MPSLAESQSRFIACLQKGPAHFPDGMFTETKDRALLGLKAHANTVSHARLVALENAYPKLHEHMGHEQFHAISRDYIDQPHILTCDMNTIAADFADFLSAQGAGGTEIDLAHIEWAWLQSYHSQESVPLALSDIASLTEDELLSLPINAHPAMCLIRLSGPLSSQLSELGTEAPFALMVVRPEAQVLFHPLTAVEHSIAQKITNISNMGNLLANAIELSSGTIAMGHIIKLVQAGAIVKQDQYGE
ncbi:DNA-binding domain-containing protein [Parasphingorhabdus halotolerans]|uniref:DUF2063 domain-containing protein n=1 Tax=Parasphingorhabdus halotolerans TaxID=2725558 RepID=A0A6H2DMF2_9SPHN|nr:DNA-binding domain-containing protein [Parasphingorhabdus halotolerans]QJB69560.1 DUF2063 domain-containing protein [Parasphingorhabdus halotolerans]